MLDELQKERNFSETEKVDSPSRVPLLLTQKSLDLINETAAIENPCDFVQTKT